MQIFLHIPKTAGSTLNHVLAQQYTRPGAIFHCDHWDPQQAVYPFLSLAPERQRAVEIFKGHFHFGAHRYLPQQASYFTLLRNPIERVISHYYYVLGTPTHQEHEGVVSRQLTLVDYVTSGLYPELNDGQTRMLAGRLGLFDQTKFGQCGEELLATATSNLTDHFNVVGIQEQFDESLLLLKNAYGWRTPYYIKQNVTRDRPYLQEIPAATLDVLRSCNQVDLQLYDRAMLRFREQIATRGPTFTTELQRFRCANRRYGQVYGFVQGTGIAAGQMLKRVLNCGG